MSKELKDFLVKLGEDSDTRRKFKEDPHGTMEEHGLSDDQKSMVLRKNKEELQDEAGLDDAQTSAIIF